jgi:hypothetical protein
MYPQATPESFSGFRKRRFRPEDFREFGGSDIYRNLGSTVHVPTASGFTRMESNQSGEHTTSAAHQHADQPRNDPTYNSANVFYTALMEQCANMCALNAEAARLAITERNLKLYKARFEQRKANDVQLRKDCLAALRDMSRRDILALIMKMDEDGLVVLLERYLHRCWELDEQIQGET